MKMGYSIISFLILFFILNGTVFYKRPSCITSNINIFDFLPSFITSFTIILTIMVIHDYYLLYKRLKSDKNENRNNNKNI